MSSQYLCPRCKGQLKVGEYLVFSVKTRNPRKGLVLLSPRLGDYQVIKHPYFDLMDGELTDFFCPICHRNLRYVRNKNFARILMIDEDYKESEILFSRKVGEQCTIQIQAGETRQFGDHSSRYAAFTRNLGATHPFQNL
jgi:uncharacterized protein YbaR (Trm112 family)